MARIALVGVNPGLRERLGTLCADHTFVSSEGIEPPDLVIADIGRIDPDDVADLYPDVPIIGFTSHTSSAGPRHARAAGFDEIVETSALAERPVELIERLLTPVE
jgi:hypothetical protein